MFSLFDKKSQVLDKKRAARKYQHNGQNKDRLKKTKLGKHDDLTSTRVLDEHICWIARFEAKIWFLLENVVCTLK